jgi:hypothetical protein
MSRFEEGWLPGRAQTRAGLARRQRVREHPRDALHSGLHDRRLRLQLADRRRDLADPRDRLVQGQSAVLNPSAINKNPAFAGLLDSGGGIRTRDLRVMSPTSYQTAPPRAATDVVAKNRPPGRDNPLRTPRRAVSKERSVGPRRSRRPTGRNCRARSSTGAPAPNRGGPRPGHEPGRRSQ